MVEADNIMQCFNQEFGNEDGCLQVGSAEWQVQHWSPL